MDTLYKLRLMRILTTISEEHEGNDCTIFNSLSVADSNGSRYLLHHQRIRGYYGEDNICSFEIESKQQVRVFVLDGINCDFTETQLETLLNY